jgi:hypothetical protein
VSFDDSLSISKSGEVVELSMSTRSIQVKLILNVVIRQKIIASLKQRFVVLNVFLKTIPIGWPHKIFLIEAWDF